MKKRKQAAVRNYCVFFLLLSYTQKKTTNKIYMNSKNGSKENIEENEFIGNKLRQFSKINSPKREKSI